DHPAAERDDGITAQESPCGEGALERFDGRQGLRVLTVVDHEGLVFGAGARERFFDQREVVRGNGRLADDRDALTARENAAELVGGTRADEDVVAARSVRDRDALDHDDVASRARNASSTSAATPSTSRPSVSTCSSAAASYAASRIAPRRVSAPIGSPASNG